VDGGDVKTATSAVPHSGSRSGTDVLSGFTESFEKIITSSGSTTGKVFQIEANADQTLKTRAWHMPRACAKPWRRLGCGARLS
jgi:flagellin